MDIYTKLVRSPYFLTGAVLKVCEDSWLTQYIYAELQISHQTTDGKMEKWDIETTALFEYKYATSQLLERSRAIENSKKSF